MRQFVVRSTGAWDRWRDDVRAEARAFDTIDALHAAAWCDSRGLDALDDGELHLAAMWFAESAGHLLRAAFERAA